MTATHNTNKAGTVKSKILFLVFFINLPLLLFLTKVVCFV
jgi:hypothetical protein